MSTDINRELAKYAQWVYENGNLVFLESNDPFQDILTSKKVKEKQFIEAARKVGLGPVPIQVGLNILEADKRVGNKKYKWTNQEIIDQLKEGVLISKETKDAHFGSKEITPAQLKKVGQTIYKELVDNLEGAKKTKEEMIKSRMSKGTSTFIHELDRKELNKYKTLLSKAWNYFNTAVQKGGYKGKLNTSDIKELVASMEKELTKINADFEIDGLENTILELREMAKKGYLWEEPDKEIKSATDLNIYFAQLEKSRMKQSGMIKQYKKKQPEYKEAKVLKSEGKEAKEKIRDEAESLARGDLRGGRDLDTDENIRILNKSAAKLANGKLSTGRTLDEFLSKTEKWDDVESNLVAELIRQIKERRGKAKV